MKTLKSIDGNYVEFVAEIKAETEKALLIFDGKVEVWIPKSQVDSIEKQEHKMAEIMIPEWLALDKGLI